MHLRELIIIVMNQLLHLIDFKIQALLEDIEFYIWYTHSSSNMFCTHRAIANS